MRMKKLFFGLTIICLTAVAALAALPVSVAYASEGAQSPHIARYCRFDGITAIAIYNGNYAVADSFGLRFFDGESFEQINDGLPLSENVQKLDAVKGGAENSDTLYALKNGKIEYYDGAENDFKTLIDVENFYIDGFEVFAPEDEDGKIYALSQNRVKTFGLDGTETTSENGFIGSVTSVSEYGGKLYYATKSGAYCNVFVWGETAPVYKDIRSAGLITGGLNGVYCVMRSGELALLTDSGPKEVTSGKYVAAVYGQDDAVIYATDIGELFGIDENGAYLIAASESDEVGFYSRPSFAASRYDKMLVADSLNDRVAVISAESETSYLYYPRPSAVWTDTSGNVIIAHSGKTVTVLKSDFTTVVAEYSLPYNVTDVYAGGDNTVYALAAQSVYRITASGVDEVPLIENVDALCTAMDGSSLFAARNGENEAFIYKIDCADPHREQQAYFIKLDTEIKDLCADAKGNFFIVAGGEDGAKVLKWQQQTPEGGLGGYVAEINAPKLGEGEISISIARTAAGGADYGDLILTDTADSLIRIIGKADAGVETMDSLEPKLKPYDEENALRYVASDCSIYKTLNENDPSIRLTAGAVVFVAKYDLENADSFCYVAYEDAVRNKLYAGFMFKSAVGEALPMREPPSETGTVYSQGANVYSIPSFNEAEDPVNAKTPVDKGTIVSLLPFAEYEAGGSRWYRVRLDNGTHGYMPVGSVSVKGFVPDSVRPQYNAEIKSYNGSVGANAYSVEDGDSYSEIEGRFLPVGTKVEVVGSFDTSVKYTKIRFFDERLGTLECYVETVYIDYNNISVVQIVAIVIGTLTFILLVILLIRLYMKKRKL